MLALYENLLHTMLLVLITGINLNPLCFQIGEWVSRVEIFDTRLRLNVQNNGNRSTPFPLKGRVAKVVMIEVSVC